MRRRKLTAAIRVAICTVILTAEAQPEFLVQPISYGGVDDTGALFAVDLDSDGDIDVLSASLIENTITWYANDGKADPAFYRHTVATGTSAVSAVFAADIDGDGDVDVLSASGTNNSVAWYENGGGTFPDFSAHTVSVNALGASAAFAIDLDGDGDKDVLSASSADNKIAWYENDGSATPGFVERTIAADALAAASVFAADVDGDGDIDVLSASTTDSKIAWYENDGAPNPEFSIHTVTIDAQGAVAVFASDLDDDGDTDLLSASSGDNSVVWYENDGAAGFTAQTITTEAAGAATVFATDVDNDGDMDVLSALSSDSVLAWYENTGAAEFTVRTISAAAYGAQRVFAADMDGDGDTDVLSASESAGAVVWYESNLRRRYSPFSTVRSIAAESVQSTFAADVDGDGDVDLISASRESSKIAWHENDGAASPSYTQRTVTTLAIDASSVFAADVDGDGDADILSASSGDNKVAWFENDGAAAPGFVLRTIATDALGASSVFAVDVDADGDIDVVSASGADNRIAWYENDGAPDPEFELHTIDLNAAGASSVFAIDVDGDGDVDVLSASAGDNKTAWYENDGAMPAGFSLRTVSTSALAATSVWAGDLDRDGDVDLLSASSGDNKVAWYENSGNSSPSFTLRTIASDALGVNAVYATDVDGDGDLDVLSGSSPNQNIAWYNNNGGSNPEFTLHTIALSTEGANTILGEDLDGDGDVDLLAGFGEGTGLAWFPNSASHRSALFESAPDITAGADGAESVYVADIDSDGDIDVLTASRLDNTVAWFENQGGGRFDPRIISTSAEGGRSVYAGDLNGDGAMDVLSASKFDNKIAWYRNDGSDDPVFTLQTITTNAMNAIAVFAADLDGDKDLDVMSASRDDNKIAWYENDGGLIPSFTERTVSTSATVALSVFAADVDGDGNVDLLSASAGDNKIAWYENDGAPSPEFLVRTIAADAGGAAAVSAADLDRDGDTDVLSAWSTGNIVAWYENDGDSNPQFTLRTIGTVAQSPFSVSAIDMDSDGDLDVLSVSRLDDKVAWYENDGASPPGFQLRTIATNADNPITAVAADLDGDGDLEVLSASFLDDRIASNRNCGGQYRLLGVPGSDQSVLEGESVTLLTLDYSHRGRDGDAGAVLDSVAVQFTDAFGAPLNTAQANGLIDHLAVYLDDGNERLDPVLDTLVSSRSMLNLTPVVFKAGVQSMALELNGGVAVPTKATTRLFVVAQIATDAASQSSDGLRFSFRHPGQSVSQASNLVSGSALSPECVASVNGGVLTVVSLADSIFDDGFERPKKNLVWR